MQLELELDAGEIPPHLLEFFEPIAPIGEKQLMMIPARLALALQADGWIIRSVFPWYKANAMPESVQDRPTTAHEWWILATPTARYYWDADAIRQPQAPESASRYNYAFGTGNKGTEQRRISGTAVGMREIYPAGRNYRTTDAWTASLDAALAYHAAELARLQAARAGGVTLGADGLPVAQWQATASYDGAHFATFGEDLIRPWVRAATSAAGACSRCGAPWRRVVERQRAPRGDAFGRKDGGCFDHGQAGTAYMQVVAAVTVGWQPACTCDAGDPVPQVVLDPFCGTGTTVAVAVQEGRVGWGVDVSETYLSEHARPRLAGTDPLFRAAGVAPVAGPVQAALFTAPPPPGDRGGTP